MKLKDLHTMELSESLSLGEDEILVLLNGQSSSSSGKKVYIKNGFVLPSDKVAGFEKLGFQHVVTPWKIPIPRMWADTASRKKTRGYLNANKLRIVPVDAAYSNADGMFNMEDIATGDKILGLVSGEWLDSSD